MSASAFPSWLERELIVNPAAIACVESYSYQIIQLPIGSLRVAFLFSTIFSLERTGVFIVKIFELIAAMSSDLRLYSSKIIFVI